MIPAGLADHSALLVEKDVTGALDERNTPVRFTGSSDRIGLLRAS